MEKKGSYLKFIAYLQIIGILLVVMGHSMHEYPGDHTQTTFYRLFQSFRMPLFLFVSGYLMIFTTRMRKGKEGPDVKTFTIGKVKRLLLPFVVLTLVTFIPRSMMSGFADDALTFSFTSLWRSFFYNDALVIGSLWFLRASFILLVFCYTMLVLSEKCRVPDRLYYFLMIVMFGVLAFVESNIGGFLSLNNVFGYGIFFVLGMAYCRWQQWLERFVKFESFLSLGVFMALWIAGYCFLFDTPWRILCSIAGILMCISLTRLMEKHGVKILDHLMGANYLIFLLSWYMNVLFQNILHHFTDFPWWIYSILSVVAGVYVPWLGYRYLQAHPSSRWVKLTAFLLGQKLKQRPAEKKEMNAEATPQRREETRRPTSESMRSVKRRMEGTRSQEEKSVRQERAVRKIKA